MGDFKKLLVWRKAHALSISVHRIASKMRGPGMAALRNQMVRAALSIPTNIVEGHGQESPRQFTRFLGYSINSGAELEQHLLTGQALGTVSETDFDSVMTELVEIRKMIYGLRQSCTRRAERRDLATAEGPATSCGNIQGQGDSDSSQ